MSLFVDMHCHLDLFQGIQNNPDSEDHPSIKTLTVTNAPSFFQKNRNLFERSNNIRVALGLHPQLVATHALEYTQFEELISETRYVGEIGLDGSPEYKSSYATQLKTFENILSYISKEPAKILSIHSRNATKETIDIIARVLQYKEHRIILHWYSGSISDLRTAIKYGFYFSINHKMASSAKGMELIKSMPDDRIITETDAPFTFSGSIKTRLASLEYSIEAISRIKGWKTEACKTLIFENFKKIITVDDVL